MDKKNSTKKTWDIPILEIINTKLTNSGGHPWYKEDAHYTDPYLSS
jgi:hypothetical protein